MDNRSICVIFILWQKTYNTIDAIQIKQCGCPLTDLLQNIVNEIILIGPFFVLSFSDNFLLIKEDNIAETGR